MAGSSPTYRVKPGSSPLWASEPFRVFFPLGLLAGMLGVLLWPMFYAGWWPLQPAQLHPRLMIFGFGMAFVTGFLGTAWPRFLESVALSAAEVILLAFLWLLTQFFYLAVSLPSGDLLAAIALTFLLVVLIRRVDFDRPLPPPGFALAFTAVAMAAGVAYYWAWREANLSPRAVIFTRLLLYQGFLLLPILGVGSYLFLRFFVVPGQKRPPQADGSGPGAPPPSAAKRFRAWFVWGAAALVVGSFGLEASGWVRSANALRLAALLIWAIGALPRLWKGRAPNTRAWALRVALSSIGLSYLLRIAFPKWLFAVEHLLFLGGFGLAMLLTADRVALGHCADPAAAPAKSKAWRWIAWIVLIAVATRGTADLIPKIMISHHIYAALLWTAAGGIWIALHARHWTRSSE
ncbi:MAG: NnrS family protein [Verrucomicrobiae bacterium]|nr:NnrS family protein [Verrucomicrobiae bacterium]